MTIQKPYLNRVSPRLLVKTTLDMKDLQTKQLLGRLFDAGEEGFMLIGKTDINDNQEYDLALVLSDLTTSEDVVSIVLTAECRWCKWLDVAGFYAAGFIVVSMDVQYRALWDMVLRNFCDGINDGSKELEEVVGLSVG